MEPHTIILDTHVHYYAQFSPDDICRFAVTNLELQAPDALPGIVLVDKEQWPTYTDFISNLSALSEFRVESHRDHAVIIFSDGDLVHRLYVFRGAQRVVREGFELLSLFNSEITFEQQSAEDLLTEINALGGVAVVPWSYGKWSGKRRSALRAFCERSRERGRPVFLGDICQRPKFFDNPQKIASAWGAAGVLGGSDPLPVAGEEAWIGSLGSVLQVKDNFRTLTIVGELKRAMLKGPVKLLGRHDSVLKGLYRRVRYATKAKA